MPANTPTWKDFILLRKISNTIRILTISDLLVVSAFGFIAPIFAIFVTDHIEGGSASVAGIASAIFLFTRSVGQIPIAALIDRIKGERDDFWLMFAGSLVVSVIPLLYLLISTPIHLYIVQFFYGVAAAATYPAWYALFTRHIDSKHEGMEWGVYQTLIDVGNAGAASIGGFLAEAYGFANVFVLVSIMAFLGAIALLGMRHNIRAAPTKT